MTWRPLVIAERPARATPDALPLDGKSGDRLAVAWGLADRADLLGKIDAINLLPAHVPYSIRAAQGAARNLRAACRGRRVVLLGRRVSNAFGRPSHAKLVSFDESRDLIPGARSVTVLPHPSGKCREWNDLDVRERVRDWALGFLRSPFVTLASGADFSLFDPEPPDLVDVAIGLSREARFSGATTKPYSVLQHSFLVAYLAARKSPGEAHLALGGLLHDAHEGVGFRDLATPVKRILGPDYDEARQRAQSAIEQKVVQYFGSDATAVVRCSRDARVHAADQEAMLNEAARLIEPNSYWDPKVAHVSAHDAALVEPWPLDHGAGLWVRAICEWWKLTPAVLLSILRSGLWPADA